MNALGLPDLPGNQFWEVAPFFQDLVWVRRVRPAPNPGHWWALWLDRDPNAIEVLDYRTTKGTETEILDAAVHMATEVAEARHARSLCGHYPPKRLETP